MVLEWTTASEVDNAGFHLYRSEAADGPYERVTQAAIPAGERPITGGRYTYTDRGVAEGKTYWYRLEDIGLDGKAALHPPVQVVAKGGGGQGLLWLVGSLGALAAFSGWLALRRERRRLAPGGRKGEVAQEGLPPVRTTERGGTKT